MKIVIESLIDKNLILENMDQAKSILAKNHIPLNNQNFIALRKMLEENKKLGYIGKFTKWMFVDREPMEKIKEIFDLVKTYPGSIPPIDKFETLENFYDFLTKSQIDTKVEQVINQIPSGTRRFADDKLRNLIKANITYANQIKKFYAKKGGKFKDAKSLYDSTKIEIENIAGGWTLENIKSILAKKKANVEIAYESEDTLVIRIKDFKTCMDLGSQSWCIATSKGQWDSYTQNFEAQYFIYDFTKERSDVKSFIGITMKQDGSVRAAHWSDDSTTPYKGLSVVKYVEKLFSELE